MKVGVYYHKVDVYFHFSRNHWNNATQLIKIICRHCMMIMTVISLEIETINFLVKSLFSPSLHFCSN